MIKKLLFWALICPVMNCMGQQEIPLYKGKIPNNKNLPDREAMTYDARLDTILSKVSVPTLSMFPAPDEINTGTAVVICPGGGYGGLCIAREGWKVAREFQKIGVSAFVLKYRLPDDSTMQHKEIVPLQDAQQAIRIVRQQAPQWKIDPQQVGIMGFSAGGHLAATAGTHFRKPVDGGTVSVRPDFMILVYPVISFTDSIGHTGSRNNLLGPSPTPAQIRFFSNEQQVAADTPPAFLTHAFDDPGVFVANSTAFFDALNRQKVPASLRIFSKGGHGYLDSPPFAEWFASCVYWLREMGWLPGDAATGPLP